MTTPQPSGQRQGRLSLRELEAGRHMAEQSYRDCLAAHERWVGLRGRDGAATPGDFAKEAMMPELERKMAEAAAALRQWMPNDRVKFRLSSVDLGCSPFTARRSSSPTLSTSLQP